MKTTLATRLPARSLLATAALVGLGCWVSAAPLAGPRQDDSPATQEDRGRALKRLVRLSDGRVLRVKARWNGEAWEVESGSGWQALPEGLVARVRLEREVEAEARRLARSVGRDDTARRVALADWMLREGLAEEALRELDRVLALDPDQPHAKALLAAPPAPLRVSVLASDDPDEVLRAAAGAPPSVRELAVHRLAELEPAAQLLERLRAGLASHSHRVRALAALGLRRLFPGEELRGLSVRSILDGSESVRTEAALALRAVEDEAVILPAVRALSSSHPAVRENAIAALGTMGYPAAVPPLISRLAALTAPQSGGDARPPRAHVFVGHQLAYIQDFDVEVAQGAAIADPIVNTLTEGSVLDVRIVGVNVVEARATESRQVRRSLATLLGEERSSKGWLEWWREHEADFPPTSPRDPSRPVTTGG